MFLESWKICRHRAGCSFRCFYSPSKKKKKTVELFSAPHKNNKTSIKEQVQCPFTIRFSIPGIKNKKRPTIFYEVNITEVNATHKCKLSPYSFRVAKRSSTSTKKIEINALNVVVQYLKLDPHLPAIDLRPLLASCLPVDTNLTAEFMKNFRRRCHLYLASNDNPQDMNISIGNNLLSTSPVTESEINILESPKILHNFRTMYATIMKNGSETWKPLVLLKEMQSQLTGFDFRIRFGDEKVPIGLVWMTYPMRQHLLQYGDVMFLDTQNANTTSFVGLILALQLKLTKIMSVLWRNL